MEINGNQSLYGSRLMVRWFLWVLTIYKMCMGFAHHFAIWGWDRDGKSWAEGKLANFASAFTQWEFDAATSEEVHRSTHPAQWVECIKVMVPRWSNHPFWRSHGFDEWRLHALTESHGYAATRRSQWRETLHLDLSRIFPHPQPLWQQMISERS